MFSKETIYLRSPYRLQQIAIALWGWWWFHRRFNSHHRLFVEKLRASERWTVEQFRAYQEQELDKLLFCAQASPYYGELFRRYGIHQGLPPFEALSRIPMLNKETLRNAPKKLLTKPPPFRTLILRSSGTTGTPTQIYSTSNFHGWWMVLTKARCHLWAGVYQNRRVMLGGRKICNFNKDSPPFWHYSPAENLAYASIYHLSERFLPSYVEFLKNFKPDLMEGYPSALAILARYATENDIGLPSAKAVCTVSESFSDANRILMEKAWQCKVFDRYTSVEGCLFASQCEFGRYHVSPEAGIIEIVDAYGQPVQPGSPGQVVATGLRNHLQPLIRYKIGDIARWSIDQDCFCGRKMPILEAIDGRFEDICYTSDGRQIGGWSVLFKTIPNIKEAQVVQEGVTRFTVNVVPDFLYSKGTERMIQRQMWLHVGKSQVNVKSVAMIPRNASGKFQPVVCKLSQIEKDQLLGYKPTAQDVKSREMVTPE